MSTLQKIDKNETAPIIGQPLCLVVCVEDNKASDCESDKCSGTTNCQDPVCTDTDGAPESLYELTADCDKCSGTTNCQVDCNVGNRVEGQCAGQRNRILSEAQLVLVDKAIREYGFDQVRYRLNTQNLLPQAQIEVAIDEYRKFLIVVAHSTGAVGMISPIVDEVWHAFILHTPDYMRFCNDVLGDFLHHQPNTPNTPSSPDAVSNFVSGYKALFGELNPIWTAHLTEGCHC